MREEAFGPVKACFPSVGESHGLEVERVVKNGRIFIEASGGGGEMGVGVKGITFEM